MGLPRIHGGRAISPSNTTALDSCWASTTSWTSSSPYKHLSSPGRCGKSKSATHLLKKVGGASPPTKVSAGFLNRTSSMTSMFSPGRGQSFSGAHGDADGWGVDRLSAMRGLERTQSQGSRSARRTLTRGSSEAVVAGLPPSSPALSNKSRLRRPVSKGGGRPSTKGSIICGDLAAALRAPPTVMPTRPMSAPLYTPSPQAVTSGDWARKPRAPARPQSAPTLNASYDTEFAYVPNLSQERLDALVVDKSRQRSHPPQLREHLQLTKWLKADDYKRCISYIIECLKQASEKSQNLSGETPEEASTRMAAAEVERVGPIEDANVRKVLLLWTLGVSLEACGEVRMAALLFSTCMQLDPSNPVHCYHRGVCLLRAGRNSSAYEDFHQAVSLCIERERRPPLIYLSCRALAGAVLPKMMPEVWADFEMVRQLSQNPDLPHRLVAQNVHDWEDYKNMVSIPVPQEGPHRHWVAVLIARCHGKHGETVSDTELRSFVRFIRGLHGLSSMTLEVAKKGLTQFSTRSVVEGQAFLLENGWYCVLSGTLDVMRFGRQTPPGELYKKLAAQGRPLVPPSGSEPANVGELAVSDPLGMPCSMEEVPELQVVDTLPEQSTFCSGDTFGPLQDGWLVAGEGGVEVLCLKLDQYKSFVRRCGGMQAQVEADVGLLKRCTLFRSCPTHVLLTMVSEIFAKREALCGEDPINAWPGLVVIRSGRLQLWADSSWGGGNPGSPHSPRGPEELCVLGPGDILGLDTVIGGPPELQVLHSKVLSHKLQAWVLPPERKEDAEDIGLQGYLREFRETHRRELLERANAANSWARHRPQALALARKHQRTIDYVRGEVDPPPRPAGGVVHSWRPRQF